MSLVGLMCVRNEADRYLEAVLTRLDGLVDCIVVFDDQSTDDTVGIAKRFTDCVVVRDDDTPSFLEHEGIFREAAWQAMDGCVGPQDSDAILSIDADELLVAEPADLAFIMGEMQDTGALAVSFPIPELWQLEPPMVRSDGWWGTLRGQRLFRWKPNARFPDKAMACGSAPTYVETGPSLSSTGGDVCLAHLGYCDPDDRQEKYDRYKDLPGHSSRHVFSILQPPTLREWTGPEIDVWRGTRNG